MVDMPIKMIPAKAFAAKQRSAMISQSLKDALRFGLFMAGVGGAARGATGLMNLGRRNLSQLPPPPISTHYMDVPVQEPDDRKRADHKQAEGVMSDAWDTTKGLAREYVGKPFMDAWKGNVSETKNWPLTYPLTFGAGMLGLYGGHKGVDAILDARRKQEQEATLEEAKKQYEAAILGKSALSQDLDTLYELWKQGEDKLPGGVADGRGDSGFPSGALAAGEQVEMEHTDDPQISKEIAKDHLAESGEYYRELAEMEAGLDKAGLDNEGTGLADAYGNTMGWGLALGLPLATISGLITYDMTKKRQPAKLLASAKRKRTRELAQRRPPALYARATMVPDESSGAADVPDADELAGEPLDKVGGVSRKQTAVNARLRAKGLTA